MAASAPGREASPEKVSANVLPGIVFMTMLILAVAIAWCLTRSHRSMRWCGRRPAPQRKKLVTKEEVEQRFPVTKAQHDSTCVVCLVSITADEPCRITQCGHVFHADCILAWWLHKPRKALRCPVCRARQHSQKKFAKLSLEASTEM
mmetsp:Transcript_19336/g.53088  ORF Transcript_19336/g.53088 Transcript_19336/m.53088 type:complete len:147 (-) Transcript_19336:32-472(-)